MKELLRILASLDLPERGTLADFGCSNGFIIENMRRVLPGWTFTGFDRHDELLSLGKEKLPDVSFRKIDLNEATNPGRFDVVTCLETLEHVGDYRAALRTLKAAAKAHIIISVPYENGIPGIVKYFGRKALRRGAFREFGAGKELPYLASLLTGANIGWLRTPAHNGWGEHFGFEHSDFLRTMREELGVEAFSSQNFFGFNRFYVYRH